MKFKGLLILVVLFVVFFSTEKLFCVAKDKEGIAIILGKSEDISNLSQDFYHVLVASTDRISCNYANVSICQKPISDFRKAVKSITFKQLIHDYVYKNEALSTKKVSFIKCDIEGGEEQILEDILCFAYQNNAKAYISFHLNWWQTKKINDFEYLFKFFKITCPHEDPLTYLQQNPFGSLLFEPARIEEPFIKTNIPAFIISCNNYTYTKNMVAQLEKYTTDIIVIDNKSCYGPLLDYYEHDFKYTLFRQAANFGCAVYIYDFIQAFVGDVYILTDPDLEFNSKLPDNFIQDFLDISNYFKAGRVGFALDIHSDDIRTDLFFHGNSVKQWEGPAWEKHLYCDKNPNLELYEASIDTTFCLINKKYYYNYHIRVAGNYTCKHLPWHKNFTSKLLVGEYETYVSNSLISNWFKK